MNSPESNQSTDPFFELRRTLRSFMIAGAVCMSIVAAIAVSGVSFAWYAVYQNVQENKVRARENTQLILSICRQNNEQNFDIITTALDLGVRPSRLTAFNPINCTRANIERRYGHE